MTPPARIYGSTRLRENIVALSALQLLNYLAPLVTLPYMARTLGLARFGLVSFAQALIVYFGLVADYGFNLSSTRDIAAHRDDSGALARIFWTTMSAKLLLTFGSGTVLAAIVMAVPRLRQTPLVFAAAFLNVAGTAILPNWLFQGLQRMKPVAAAQAVSRILTIPALLAFVRRPDDYLVAAVIQGAYPVAAAVFLAPVVWERSGRQWYVPTRDDLRMTFHSGWHLFLSNSVLTLSTSITAVILGFVAGDMQVGYFSGADKVIKALTSLFGPVTQALYPHLASLKANPERSPLDLIRKSFRIMTAIALVASVGAFTAAGPITRIIFGTSIPASVAALRWLSPLPLLLGLVSVFGTQTMMVYHMDAAVSKIVLRCTLVILPLITVLSLAFGAVGAAASSTAGALLIAGSMAICLRRQGLAVWRRN